MKAYILQSDRRIEPFDDYAHDCQIANKALRAWQIEACKSIGISNSDICTIADIGDIDHDEDVLVFRANLFFTRELLASFVAMAKKRVEASVCAVGIGLYGVRTLTCLQDVKNGPGTIIYELRYVPRGTDPAQAGILSIDIGNSVVKVPAPSHMLSSSEYRVPLSSKLIASIDHWANLWSVNVLSALLPAARLNESPKKYLLAMRAMSTNQWKLLKHCNSIGKNCDIHPSVNCIEGSVIGDNVTIGAGSVIRESVIGDGTVIGNNCSVESSIIGRGCSMMQGHLLYSVLSDETFFFTQTMSASMVGKRCFIGSGTVLTDFRFDGKNVQVMSDGKLVDSGNTFVGCCLGHDVYQGSGSVIMPGRSIPNQTKIIP